jgi:hypothetical protein
MSSTSPAATATTASDSTSTPHAATQPLATPSQPAAATQPITAAQRQWAYRQRSKRAMTEAIGEEAQASRVTLIALLAYDLALLSDKTASRMHPGARNGARRIINTLVTRYAIDLDYADRT